METAAAAAAAAAGSQQQQPAAAAATAATCSAAATCRPVRATLLAKAKRKSLWQRLIHHCYGLVNARLSMHCQHCALHFFLRSPTRPDAPAPMHSTETPTPPAGPPTSAPCAPQLPSAQQPLQPPAAACDWIRRTMKKCHVSIARPPKATRN